MPLYEYQCDACGKRFERIQKFSDPPVDVCPACGGPVKKLVSSPAIQFKGSGWYITDYAKSGSSPAPAKSEKTSEDSSPKTAASDAKASEGTTKSDSAPKAETPKSSSSKE